MSANQSLSKFVAHALSTSSKTAQLAGPLKRREVPASEESWLESALGWFGGACDKLDRAIEKFFAPFVEELQGVTQDLHAVSEPETPAQLALAKHRLSRRQGEKGLVQIFSRNDRQRLFDQLAPAEKSDAVNPEEQAAETQLLVGVATIGMNLLAALFNPAFYLVGIAGLLYQARFIFSEAYRGVVHEKRVNIYGLNTVMISVAALSGSLPALTIGMVSASFLRWIIAKTESAAQRSVAAAFLRQPQWVWMVAGDAELQVRFAQVTVGDTLIVSAGELIPVDGVITKGLAVVDQHMLTGESQLVEKSPGDAVLASSILLRGKIYVRLEHSGNGTVAAQVAQALGNTSAYKHEIRTRTERRLDRMAIPMLGLSALTVPLWGVNSALAVLWGIPGYRMMYLAPLTMLSFMHALARNGVLIKNGQALERLREVDTVVLDKTGTLTLTQPIAGRIFCYAELTADEVVTLAASAEHRQSHPSAAAILQLASQRGLSPRELQETQVTVGFGVQVTVDGQRILVGSERMMAMAQVELRAAATQHQAEVHELGNGLIFIAREHELVGAIEICSALRPGAEELVTALRQRGKQVIIISGDQEAPTRTLAAQLRIERYFAQTLPQDKARLIGELQQEGRVVCFVGDGINDSLALQRADVSVSMKGATSIASTVAQVVLMNDDLNQLNFLVDVADRFEDYMRMNRLSTNIPAFVILAGTLGLGWSLLNAVLINQISIPISFYNLARPLQEFAANEPLLNDGEAPEPAART